MSRTQLSVMVDADLLRSARQVSAGETDAVMVDEALRALLVRHRAGEIAASDAVYDVQPVHEPDAWAT